MTSPDVTPVDQKLRGGASVLQADDEASTRDNIGWVRAVVSGIIVLLVGFGGGVLGANAILTKALGLTRDARQWLATALFLVVMVVLAWALRWLQGRGLI